MINPRTLFHRAVATAFCDLQPKVTAEVKAGPFGLRIGFFCEALAKSYLRSFVAGLPNNINLSVMVLTPDEIDLSELVPVPSERGRTFVDDQYVVVWYADRLPILYVLNRRTRQGIVWLSQRNAPEWELSRPACPLIHASLFEGPWTTAHGGAVGRDDRMLLLAGKGRAGKTTAALACADAGWDYAGDDYILANTHSGQVEPLYTSARLRIDMTSSFARLLPAASVRVSHADGETRHELALGELLGMARSRGGRLAAILLPRRRGAVLPEFTPARRADAFQALFMTTSLGVPSPLKLTTKKLSALVALAPAFFVDTGQTPAAIPEAFGNFLDVL
jgi:hypothetical protein